MRHTRRIALFLTMALTLLIWGSAALAVDLVVELPGSIECRDGAFHLGEYALLDGDAELAAGASMALITPMGGVFTRNDVIAALGATNVAGRDVALRMPDRVRVVPESPVAAQLRTLANWKWRIDVQGISPEHWSGAESFSLPPKVLPGARTIAVKFDRGGRKANKQAKLKWYQPVVYATRDLDRGAPLSRETLRVRIDTVGMMKPCAWDPSQLSQATLDEPVRAGRSISLGDVEQLQLVKSGSLVSLVASVNGLAVSVQGIALERGAIGDTIRVRNLSSKKVMTGKVIDVGRVEIN